MNYSESSIVLNGAERSDGCGAVLQTVNNGLHSGSTAQLSLGLWSRRGFQYDVD